MITKIFSLNEILSKRTFVQCFEKTFITRTFVDLEKLSRYFVNELIIKESIQKNVAIKSWKLETKTRAVFLGFFKP